jgi:hypothetical protein
VFEKRGGNYLRCDPSYFAGEKAIEILARIAALMGLRFRPENSSKHNKC